MNYSGVLRIRNPKTLERWIKTGKHKRKLELGLIFNVGCGRYRPEKCECNKCQKSNNSPLQKVLDAYEKQLEAQKA